MGYRPPHAAGAAALVAMAVPVLAWAVTDPRMALPRPALAAVVAVPLVGLVLWLGRRDPRDHEVADLRSRVAELGDANRHLTATTTELEAFTGRVAHDLRSPLGTVVTTLETVARPDLTLDDDTRAALVAQALRASRRAVDTVEGLRDHATSGARPVEGRLVDVARLAEEVLASLPGDRARGVVLEVPDRGSVVWADPRLLPLVLQNLVANALTHGGAALSHLRLRVESTVRHAEVVLEDDGVGIPVDQRESVFRVGTGAHRPGGMGLGLATCRSIVERHGGQIHATGSPLGGTAVHLTLPWPGDHTPVVVHADAAPTTSPRPVSDAPVTDAPAGSGTPTAPTHLTLATTSSSGSSSATSTAS